MFQSNVIAETLFAPTMHGAYYALHLCDRDEKMRREGAYPQQAAIRRLICPILRDINDTEILNRQRDDKNDSRMCKAVHSVRSNYFLSCDVNHSVIF